MLSRALFILLVLAGGCGAVTPAAAVVNGQKVSEAEIQEEIDRARDDASFKELLRTQGDEFRGTARRQVLTGYIRVTLQLQQAGRMKLGVGRRQVDEVVRNIERQSGGAKEFQAFLKQNILTRERLRELVRRRLVAQELEKAVTRNLKVDEAKVQAAYDQNKSSFSEVRLARITVADQAEARDVAAKASEGADFAALAKQRSKDPAAQKGGDLGFVDLSDNAALAAQIEPVPVGGVAGPVQGRGGFEVYKVIERRTKPLEAVRGEIADRLLQRDREAAFGKWLEDRLRKAQVRVNPKYGRFDRRRLEVVAGTGKLLE